MKTPMTREEEKWRSSAYDSGKTRKRLKLMYILLGILVALGVVYSAFSIYHREVNWPTVFILVAGYVNCALGIIRNRRILRGKATL